jgi:hypothetical protein
MKIGVTSDTHSRPLPRQLLDDFRHADLIVHAGDFCDSEVLTKLERIKDVKAVYGNMDGAELRKRLRRREIFKAGPYAIGLFHGEGAPQQLLSRVQEEFKGEKLDVIIFGHSHQAFNEKIGEVLYFNPGSPNDDVSAPYCSYGLIEISENDITGKIVKI